MKRLYTLFGVILATLVMVVPASAATVTSTNPNGWVIDTFTPPTSTFTTAQASTGAGSLQIGPIGASEKFIMFPPYATASSDTFTGFSYDVYIDPTSTRGTEDFYINIYVDLASNGIGAFTLGFYDCRYDYVPSTSTTGTWQTYSITPATDFTTGSNRITNGGGCPNTIGALGATDQIIYMAVNGGQSIDSDIGLLGYLDNIILNGTQYDFEANTATIIDPETGEKIFLPSPLDDRINYYDRATPIAAYPEDFGEDEKGIMVYEIQSDSKGVLEWQITPEMLASVPEMPDENVLVGQKATDQLVMYLYRLASGEWQFNIIQPNGKMYVLIFTEIVPGGGGYTSFEYVME